MSPDRRPKGSHLKRRCMRDSIRDTLASRMLDGTYAPGERLIELNLAREFNVSQAPVREALRELEALGLVESERYRGTRVSAPKPPDLQEAFELRAILEERAAQMAVPCSPEVLGYLAAVREKMHTVAMAGQAIAYAREVVHFHRKVVEASGNRVFLHTWDTLQLGVRVQIATLHVNSDLPSYAQAHDPILQALREGDGVMAGRLLRQLIERVLVTVARVPIDG